MRGGAVDLGSRMLAIVARALEWLTGRAELLTRQKEFDHECDKLTEARIKICSHGSAEPAGRRIPRTHFRESRPSPR